MPHKHAYIFHSIRGPHVRVPLYSTAEINLIILIRLFKMIDYGQKWNYFKHWRVTYEVVLFYRSTTSYLFLTSATLGSNFIRFQRFKIPTVPTHASSQECLFIKHCNHFQKQLATRNLHVDRSGFVALLTAFFGHFFERHVG